ncbi:unnamed protein product [Soboliphyme baturini]|uniref:Ig-like domain-containing protein n=1 Tax=Soboliphyme baturini TaxID=241478 RepID=A0A183ISQ2_9BILA|nr:unnamed protein product [Soboliphyme baturini]
MAKTKPCFSLSLPCNRMIFVDSVARHTGYLEVACFTGRPAGHPVTKQLRTTPEEVPSCCHCCGQLQADNPMELETPWRRDFKVHSKLNDDQVNVLTTQGRIFNFLERPVGFRCYFYHVCM